MMTVLANYKKIISAVVMLAFSLFAYLASFLIEDSDLVSVGPRTIPQLVTIFMILLSAFCLYTSVRGLHTPKETPKENLDHRSAFLTLILLGLYVLLFSYLGFIVDSILYLFLQFCILSTEKRQYKLYAVISVITTLAIYAFFRYVLLLMLPSGILPI